MELRSWKQEANKVAVDACGVERALLEAEECRRAAEVRAVAAEAAAADALVRLVEAEEAFDEATEEGMEAEKEAAELAAQVDATHEEQLKSVAYALMLVTRREERAKVKVTRIKQKLEGGGASPTTADEWLKCSREAQWKRSQRDRAAMEHFLSNPRFTPQDIAIVLAKLGLHTKLFDTPAFFEIYYDRVDDLMDGLETNDFGISLALYLHYEHHIPLPKILQMTQAACKRYVREDDSYKAKVLLRHRFRQGEFIKVPSPPHTHTHTHTHTHSTLTRSKCYMLHMLLAPHPTPTLPPPHPRCHDYVHQSRYSPQSSAALRPPST